MTVTVNLAATDGATSTVPLPAPVVNAAGGAGFGQPVMPPPPGFTSANLKFQDTFQGTTLNLAKWNPLLGANNQIWNNFGKLGKDSNGFPYTGQNTPITTEVELMAKSQIGVNNGCTITTVPNTSNLGGGSYSALSGSMITHTPPGSGPGVTASFTLPSTGTWYLQIRCKCPDMTKGINPGLWFLPATGSTGNEIDFIQGGLNPGASPNANYYPLGAGWTPTANTPNVGFDASAGFHIYGMKFVWGGNTTMYVDGTQILQFSNSGKPACGYEIIIDCIEWKSGLGWAVPYAGGTSTWQIAEVQVYSSP